MVHDQSLSPVNNQAARQFLLIIAYLGFISLGLPDPVAGVAWPSVRELFALPQSSFGLVFIGLGCGYCLSGFFGGQLAQRWGLGNLLWISSGCVAVAMLGSATAPVWPLFVVCTVIWGLGSGGIDAGLNAYASNHFSARHMNWLHACYSVGATLGPLLMTATLVQANSWRLGYLIVGVILFLMAVLFLVTRQLWTEPPRTVASEVKTLSIRVVLLKRQVWLQILIFFLYVGLEFTVGQWSFTLLTELRGLPPDIAGLLAGAYYGAIGVGRVLTGLIAHRIGLDRILRFAMSIALFGAFMLAIAPAGVCAVALILIGLGLAPIFPCLMSRTPERLGADYAAHAIGFQLAAGMFGAAVLPGLAGLLADSQGLSFIAWFAVLLAGLMFSTYEILLRQGSPLRV